MDDKLAILGGTPVRDIILPYGKQYIDNSDIEAVVGVLKSNYITCGPKIEEFENAVAEFVGAKYSVAVNSGTAALHAACFAAGIGAGDEVITTPMTFAASANCVLYMGAKPVFADIDPNTYNINPQEIEKIITSRTKAIIPVDFTGQPVELDTIKKIAQKHNLMVIEDAAHALGSEYNGKKVGSISDLTEFSFHPVKHITTGEGGMVTTNDAKLYERLKMFRTHGITRDSNKMFENHGAWYYEMQELGFNYRITDMQAALGTSQLKKLERFIQRRQAIIQRYNKEFLNIEEITTPYQKEGCNSAWHLYIIRLKLEKLKVDRKQIFDALKGENIGVNVHYIPIHYFPYYKKLGYQKGLCPNAEKLYEEIITIPLFPSMEDKDVDDVIKAVKKVIAHFRK